MLNVENINLRKYEQFHEITLFIIFFCEDKSMYVQP